MKCNIRGWLKMDPLIAFFTICRGGVSAVVCRGLNPPDPPDKYSVVRGFRDPVSS